MRQFRDSYSGALVFTQTEQEKTAKSALNEMREIRDEIKAERQLIEELKRGDGDENQPKQNTSK